MGRRRWVLRIRGGEGCVCQALGVDRLDTGGVVYMGESFEERQARWQKITNERPIPPRRLQQNCNVPVRARIVWERDGEEFRDTIAYAWGPHGVVLVEVLDDRRQTIGVWLHVSDAPRR